MPLIGGEGGRVSSGRSRCVSCFCFPSFDLNFLGMILGCNLTVFSKDGRQSCSLLLTIYAGGRPVSLLEEKCILSYLFETCCLKAPLVVA